MLYSRDVISAVPLAMKAHSSSPALLKAAVNLLTALSSDGKCVCVADHDDSCGMHMQWCCEETFHTPTLTIGKKSFTPFPCFDHTLT